MERIERWQNRSPGDLSVMLPEVQAGEVEPALQAATEAADGWARTPLPERIERLRVVQGSLVGARDRLARAIALETGKPLSEAVGELGAVIAKIDLSISDAESHLSELLIGEGPHPALVRRRPRGPAVVIGPFNFPLHLGHGANVAYLLAGNPVIFKPSPLAANVAADYGALMAEAFPPGVFSFVQGGGSEGEALACDPRVRAVCFTGSVTVGRTLARNLVADFSKDLALELGGRNASIICADADLELAAQAVADAISLTCGQRCNATSRILVDQRVSEAFEPLLVAALERYVPGDPLLPETRLGPLIHEAAFARYQKLIGEFDQWILPGQALGHAHGKMGYYVTPAIRRGAVLPVEECFVPIADYEPFVDLDDAVARHQAAPFGLSASIFTRSEVLFRQLGDQLTVGNLYANLPTTFSPSTLPFGGVHGSGNGRPGGRGFMRFVTEEQAVQWRNW